MLMIMNSKYFNYLLPVIITLLLFLFSCTQSADIDSRLDAAQDLVDNYYYMNAVEICDDIIKKYPNNARAYEIRGDVYALKKEYHMALSDYSLSFRNNSDNPNLLIKRGGLYRESGNFSNAEIDYSKALEMGLSLPSVFLGRGISFCRMGHYSEAIDDLTEYFNLVSNNNPSASDTAIAFLNRGIAFYRFDRLDEAVRDLTNALKLDSQNAEIYFVRGQAFISLKRNNEAIDDFSKGLSIDNTNPDMFMNRALLYYNQGEYYLAYRDSKSVLSLEPDNKQAKNLADITASFLDTIHR